MRHADDQSGSSVLMIKEQIMLGRDIESHESFNDILRSRPTQSISDDDSSTLVIFSFEATSAAVR